MLRDINSPIKVLTILINSSLDLRGSCPYFPPITRNVNCSVTAKRRDDKRKKTNQKDKLLEKQE